MTSAFWVYFAFDLLKEEIIDINPKLCSEINKDNKTIKLFDNKHPKYGCLLCAVHYLGISGQRKQKPTTTWVGSAIYGDGGFEPASRGPDTNLSTCVVY